MNMTSVSIELRISSVRQIRCLREFVLLSESMSELSEESEFARKRDFEPQIESS